MKQADSPTVTIVIPAYNHEKYVREAIDSVLAQTFDEFELIVIDDGSTDRTTEIVNEYAGHEKIYVYHQENQGLSRTLNRGLEYAKGKYFGFLPSDDRFMPEKLYFQVDYLENNAGIAALGSLQHLIDADGKPLHDKNMDEWFSCEPEGRSMFIQTLFERNFISAPSVLMRTGILKELGGFDPDIVFMQDYDLWFRIVAKHEMAVMPKELIEYRWHGENQTFKATPDSERERGRVLMKAVTSLEPEDIFPSLHEDRRPEVVMRCRNVLCGRLSVYPAVNIKELNNIVDEKFTFLLDSFQKEIPSSESGAEGVNSAGSYLNILIEVAVLHAGGLEQVVYDLAKGLSARGHKIVVACVERGGVMADRLATDGILVEVLPSYSKHEAYRRILKLYNIDLVNSHFSTFGTAIAFENSVPVVSCIHNIYTWLDPYVVSEFRSVDRYVSAYAAVSDDAAQFIQCRMNITPDKIAVIPNGIDIEKWEQKQDRAGLTLTNIEASVNDYIFICSASISRLKGQERIINILPELLDVSPDVKVIFAGAESDKPFVSVLRHRVKKTGVEHAVRFVNFTDKIHSYYSLADAFVLPSLIEGWSIAMLEAMFCGLPVIMTDIGGFRTIMENHEAGMAIPAPYDSVCSLDRSSLDRFSTMYEDPMERPLLDAMKEFVTNREKWRQIGFSNANYVRHNFDISSSVLQYEKLFLRSIARFSAVIRQKNAVMSETVKSMSGMVQRFGEFNRNARLLESYTEWNKFLIEKQKETEEQFASERIEFERERGVLIQKCRQIESEYHQYKKEVESLVAQLNLQLDSARDTIHDLDERLRNLQEWVEQIVSSTSWKVTAPMRFVSIKFRSSAFYCRRAIYLLKNGGITTLAAAIRRRLSNTYIQSNFCHRSDDSVELSKCQPLFDRQVVMFAIVPFDDVGGGQRSAQLSRVLTARGIYVKYIYGYPKVNVNTGEIIPSRVKWPLMEHRFVDDLSLNSFFDALPDDTILIFEAPLPSFYPYLAEARKRDMHTVFELIDEWDSSLGGSWFDRDTMLKFFDEAVTVTGTAKALVKILEQSGRKDAIYLPNAANEHIFDKYTDYPVPDEFKGFSGRKFLYFGSLYGDWFSWDCLRKAAKACPDSLFLLIGEPPDNIDVPHNIVFPGAKPIESLPAYLAHCDAALLPFIPGKISDAVSPVKIFEYLFMEKPVIATSLPEITGMPGVHTAKNATEFASLCKDLPITTQKDNDSFISCNSWSYRADILLPSKEQQDISVIILVHNNRNIIGRCLDTMLLHGQYDLKEIIVVDNASNDGSADYIRQRFPSVQVIENSVNGCSSGRNLGASVATGEFLAFFDSDQWLTSRSCFEEARAVLTSNKEIGAVGWSAGWFEKGRKDLGGMIVDYLPDRGNNREMCERGFRTDIGYLATSGMFMEKRLFDQIDGFDVSYDPTCFEDTDLSFQIKAAGFEIAYRDFVGIRHQPHQTTRSGSAEHQALFERNAAYMKQKWCHYKEFFIDYTP